ncbi:MAG: LysE family translocator [Flavobacteriaceae bacterium]|nr:LysE family translocator [Flavobacteriaceae bacterium]
MIESLISFALATLVLAISPGPDNIYVLTQSIVNGTRSGIATTAGLISGCIVHTTLLAFGVSAVVTSSPEIFYGIKILGALYLFYLAYTVFKSDSKISFTENAPKKNYAQLFKTGVIMNLFNPKVMIFFLAFFPGFLWNTSENTVSQFYILGITFMAVSFVAFSSIALLAGSISDYILKHKKVGLYLKWLQIVVFIGIAVFILIP